MKTNLVSSQRVKVRVIEFEDADILAAVQAGKVAELTIAVNADRRQKVALVEFRQDLSEKIETVGFKRLTETITKDGKASEEYTETEGEHIARTRVALSTPDGATTKLKDGTETPLPTFRPVGFVLPPGDEKVREAAANAWIQGLAFECGDKKDEAGLPAYQLDISRPEPKAKTGKLEQAYIDGATKIIANGNASAWATKFAKGFTSPPPNNIPIDPFTHEDFLVAVPEDADATAAEAIRAKNVHNLALALRTYRKQEAVKLAALRQGEFD